MAEAAKSWPGLFPWVAAGVASSWAFLARTVMRQRSDAVRDLDAKMVAGFNRIHERLDYQDVDIKAIMRTASELQGQVSVNLQNSKGRRK